MKRIFALTLSLGAVLAMNWACDSKKDPVASGREAVKEVVTQPFKTLESAKESLDKSGDKTKTALEDFDKESKP